MLIVLDTSWITKRSGRLFLSARESTVHGEKMCGVVFRAYYPIFIHSRLVVN